VLEEIAMNCHPFVAKFSSSIVAVLGCFDRVIFKGYLPFGNDAHLNYYVDQILGMPRKNFLPFLEGKSEQLVQHAKALAEQQGAAYLYLQGPHRKEQIVQKIIRERRLREGLVCVLCCLETCRSVKLFYGQNRPRLAFSRRPQRVLYYYFLDPQFGLRHVRIQTWFPFTTQAYVNGHDWLARQLHKQGVGFVQQDNAFTELDNPVKAQMKADQFSTLPWSGLLGDWMRQVNPLLDEPWLSGQYSRWVVDQAEYSTDVVFADRSSLAALYPRLLEHASLNFSAPDILSFLGRRLHPRFEGEVLSDCKKDRWPGARIKHRVKNNWLKMYDKFGQILRIETVINNPREFKIRERQPRQGRWRTVMRPMNKGVNNLYRYWKVARTANESYLEALAVVNDPQPAYRRVEDMAWPKVQQGRSYAGFNPARRQDVELFRAVLAGSQALDGFRNGDVRLTLYGEILEPKRRRRKAAAVGRQFKRLHVRGLIAKVPCRRRWRVTVKGQSLMGAVVRLYHNGLPTAA
jgi:hypothetical protein